MKDHSIRQTLRLTMLFCLAICATVPLLAAIKNWAIVISPSSKLQDVSLAELSKFCKGTQKTWPDGRNFTFVVQNPDSPEMRGVLGKLFGVSGAELKPALAKMNESRTVLKVVESEEDLIRTVGLTPGAVGLMDVYSINSSVKVLRVEGKLPFDAGYVLKGN